MRRAFGIAALVVLAPLALFVLSAPPSASGAAYVASLLVLAFALVVKRNARRVAIAGGALLVATIAFRLVATKSEDVRTIDRVIDERDVALNASRALALTAFVRDPDVPRVPDAMRRAYDEMQREEGDLPSPVVSTYLGLQRPGASDAIEFRASGRDAVIFLHGSQGNFTMSCWLFARAARDASMTTVCPSTSAVGDWWTTDGERIVRDAIAALRARGFRDVYLAGLSNGAIGASRLAPKLAIAGLVLVSGAAPDAPGASVPTLVVHGRADAMIHASVPRAYAARAGARYVELDAGHFALLVDHDRASRAITDFLESQRAARATARSR